MKRRQSSIIVNPGQILKVFSPKEAQGFRDSWLDIFCKQKQGVNTKDFLWHIFSSNRFPSVSGDAAKNEYLLQRALEYVVLSNDSHLAISTNIHPSQCNLSDYYISPVNLAWTMAFTHEEGWYGPYFARNPDYENLNKHNLLQIKKMAEFSNAKQKGWV